MNNDRSWAEVNLDSIAHNYGEFKRLTAESGSGAKVMCVIKADGYGHGSAALGLHLQSLGCGFFGVAALDEALELCRAGVTAPVLVLNYIHPQRYGEALEYPNIRLTVFDPASAGGISEAAARRGVKANIHVKLDTGMTRVGFAPEEAAGEIARMRGLPGIAVEGLFTHFASADEADPAYTEMQFERYSRAAAEAGDIPLKHVCNSAASMMFPHMHLDMIRLGISLYGCYPSDEVDKARVSLRPAMSFKTRVVRVKEVPPGVCVSYGRTFTTARPSVLATIPVGYADGISRLMRGMSVLVNGREAPIVGRICMDQCVVDVTDIGGAKVLDEVELYGTRMPVERAAAVMGTINYEVLCMVGRRVPRVYFLNGKAAGARKDLLGSQKDLLCN